MFGAPIASQARATECSRRESIVGHATDRECALGSGESRNGRLAVRRPSRGTVATRSKLLILLIAGLMAPAASTARDVVPDTKVGNFLFKMPSGWKAVDKGSALVVYAPSPGPRTITYFALAAEEMEGDLQNSFRKLWQGFANSNQILEGGQPQPFQSNKRYDAIYTSAIAADQHGMRWSVFVLGAQYRKRMQTVMFMSNLPPGSARDRYFGVFKQTFLASLSFGDSLPRSRDPGLDTASVASGFSSEPDATTETDSTDKSPAGALEGIYVGFGLNGPRMERRNYYFTADGWVINNIPFVDMDHFDMTAYRRDPSNKLFVGRYRVDGNQIHIVWANNADRRDVIKFDETAANPGIDTFIPTCRCKGKRFSGKYHWSSPTDERFVQFFPDGTFFDHGLIDQVVGVPNPHGYSGITDRPRNFRGTYSADNQKLTFHFADGKQATVSFVVPKALKNAPAFEWMGLGHGTGVPGAETVVLLTLYEEHYQVQP